MTNATLPSTDSVSVADVRRMIEADPQTRLLDVRTGGEYAGVHIPGSYNVPLDTLGAHAADLAAIEHTVVLVCRSGARAGQAHSTLTTAGKDKLHILTGGIEAWDHAGADVVRGDTEVWAMDRQVRLVAGSISLVGILASLVVPRAKWLSGGVAAGLTFSALSNTCAMGNALARLPYNKTDNGDIVGVLDALRKGSQ